MVNNKKAYWPLPPKAPEGHVWGLVDAAGGCEHPFYKIDATHPRGRRSTSVRFDVWCDDCFSYAVDPEPVFDQTGELLGFVVHEWIDDSDPDGGGWAVPSEPSPRAKPVCSILSAAFGRVHDRS